VHLHCMPKSELCQDVWARVFGFHCVWVSVFCNKGDVTPGGEPCVGTQGLPPSVRRSWLRLCCYSDKSFRRISSHAMLARPVVAAAPAAATGTALCSGLEEVVVSSSLSLAVIGRSVVICAHFS
jgi:hypothetical protein